MVENISGGHLHNTLPEEISGYGFDPEWSWWSTIVPEASVNLIVNPSFEAWNSGGNADEYDLGGTHNGSDFVEFPPVGASAGRRAVKVITSNALSWVGYNLGLAVTPGPYTFSLDVYVTRSPFVVSLQVRDYGGGATVYAQRDFRITASGWQRLYISYVETGSGLREARLAFPATNPAGATLYSDAWQFEAKPYPTTYLDGDMIGFDDLHPEQSYFWMGEAHQSQSVRRHNTASGGRVVSWTTESNFQTTSIVGLDMAPVEQITQNLASGGQVHLGVAVKARTFTITGRIFGNNYRQLKQRHGDLTRLMRPNNTHGRQQMVLRYQQLDTTGVPLGTPLEISAVYTGGLEGNITNFYQETLALQFSASSPALRDTVDSAIRLRLYDELIHNNIVYVDEDGQYQNAGTGTTDSAPLRVGFMRNGNMVAFGAFGILCGSTVANAARWTGTAWVQMGSGLGVLPAGTTAADIDSGYPLNYPLVIATTVGGIYEYDEVFDTWTKLGDFNSGVRSVQRAPNGDLWIGGVFAQDDAATTTYNNIARYNYATQLWETIGAGVTSGDPTTLVNVVFEGGDGYVYIGGQFMVASAPTGAYLSSYNIIRWHPETKKFSPMGTLAGEVKDIVRGKDGLIYATGKFASDASTLKDLRGFARWNGFQWEEPFVIQKLDGSYGADGMVVDEDGILWFYNFMVSSTDLFVVPGLGNVAFFGWRDGVFYPPTMPEMSVAHLAIGPGDRMVHATRNAIGGLSIGMNFKVPAYIEIDYEGGADAPVAIHWQGPGRPIHIRNLSTRGGLYFRGDLALHTNELMTLRTDAQKNMVYSNARPNLFKYTAVGASNTAGLRLMPGINRLSVLGWADTVGVSEVWLRYRNHHWGLEGAY